jgi:hypothetical protein
MGIEKFLDNLNMNSRNYRILLVVTILLIILLYYLRYSLENRPEEMPISDSIPAAGHQSATEWIIFQED